MRLFNLFKLKPKCRHTKKVGECFPPNMQEVFRFSPYKSDSIGFGIAQCSECRKRMFTCAGYHLMGERKTTGIDRFIKYELSEAEFIDFLEKQMTWYKQTNKAGRE